MEREGQVLADEVLADEPIRFSRPGIRPGIPDGGDYTREPRQRHHHSRATAYQRNSNPNLLHFAHADVITIAVLLARPHRGVQRMAGHANA